MSEIAEINPDTEAHAERARVLRVEMQAVMERDGLSAASVGNLSGIGVSTMRAWLNDSYTGRVDNVNAKVETWLKSQASRDRMKRAVVKAPEFLDLPSADTFMTVFEFCQAGPDMGLITGGSGIGKTSAAEKYQKRSSNVWVMTCVPTMTSPGSVLNRVRIDIELAEGRARDLEEDIVRKLRGTGGLLIVDEAQHLRKEGIDTLRMLHDRAKIGVVFVGNESLRKRIEGMSRDVDFAMIFSRVGMRKKRDKPITRDIAMLLDAWGVVDQECRATLRWIALQPGALRQMTKVLTYARMIARGADREVETMRDIEAAWKELTSGELPARAV
ncbi:MAG: AAA family ATPase [Acetobacter sp.]|uniref:AAA family ATPase n=1 Tax=Acetobacter sp. TaxID=440 RepID=UPI0039EAEDDE